MSVHVNMIVCVCELEEDLLMMEGSFVEVCKRKGLKVNGDKRKVRVLGGEEGLECEIRVDGLRLESELKYLVVCFR